jgi:hypothetical protein
MIANVDVDKLVDLLIKYKTQVSYLVAFILCAACFIGGRMTSQCPPKSVVCEAEETIIKSLRGELSQKDDKRVEMLRNQKDEDRLTCDERVEQAKVDQMTSNNFLQCSDICVLFNQCEAAGRCK